MSTRMIVFIFTLAACADPPVAPRSPGPDGSAPAEAGADAAPGAVRAKPTMSDAEALRWARALDPSTFDGLSVSGAHDFSVLGALEKGVVLWVRSDDIPYGSGACRPITFDGDGHTISGAVSRSFRENGDAITESYTVELGRSASLLGPGRTVKHPDGTTSGSGTGCLHVMGHLSEVRSDRVVYAGCPLRIDAVACDMTEERVYDGCPEGRRTCTKCGHVRLTFKSHGACMVARARATSVAVTHDCAPCAPDPLAEKLPELERELVGREVTSTTGFGLALFKSRQACDASTQTLR